MIVLRTICLLVSFFAVAGCSGPRAVTGIGSPRVTKSPSEAIIPFMVATNRGEDKKGDPPFTTERSVSLNFASIDVSVPVDRQKGSVRTSTQQPDPARHFTASNLKDFSTRADFAATLDKRLMLMAPGHREIFIFVHGYNNNFAESLFRNAQIVNDYNIRALPLHYAWPSAATLTGYIHDQNSALIARNGLAETLEIAATSRADSIVLVGHSMGAYVVMEALRTLALQHKTSAFKKFRGVLLAAPDIDPDVFSSQVDDIPELPQPFTVIVSRRDRALSLSRRLAMGAPRIGSGLNVELLQKKNVQVFDLSDMEQRDHSAFAASNTLIQLMGSNGALRQMLTDSTASPDDPMLQARQAAFDSAALVIHLPIRLLTTLGGGN